MKPKRPNRRGAYDWWVNMLDADVALADLKANIKMRPGTIFAHNDVDTNIRRSHVGWPNDDIRRRITDPIARTIRHVNKLNWGLHLWDDYEVQFTYYTAEDRGAYELHMDCDMSSMDDEKMRKVSAVVQLSCPNSYEGGDLRLFGVADNPHGRRQRGSMTVFPSFVTHSITELTKGERYSLVFWISGPRFR